MSDETTPSVEEIKERLKVEIPVAEDPVAKSDAATSGKVDIVAELRQVGRQFADTLQSAWNSEERQRVGTEIRDGLKSFADEVDHMLREVKSTTAVAKVKEEASHMVERVESSELSRKARESVAQGLQWLSEELGRLANQFTPAEKPAAEAAEEAVEADTSAP